MVAKPKVRPELLDRQPPANTDAERAVLASMLLLPVVIDDITTVLHSADFYDQANAAIYGHLAALHESGKRADMSLLTDRLRKAGQYDAIGGAAYLAEVVRSAATAANGVYYANIVRDAATQRAVIAAATEALRDGYDIGVDPDTLLERSEAALFAVRERRLQGVESICDASELIEEAMALISKRERGELDGCGLETGFVDLDSLLFLRPGELTIVAARPSMGKTAMALQIALHAAIEQRQVVMFFSLEMSGTQIADRMLASRGRVDSYALTRPPLAREENQKLLKAAADISAARFSIDDSPGRSVSEIAALCRRQARKSLGLIVVDYLQLITPADSRAPREQQVAAMARDLKNLARSLNVPVIVAAQLNRQSESAVVPRPKLHHLRESGSIEQDADIVMFIHRAEMYLTPKEREELKTDDPQKILGTAEVIIAKHRNGRTGDVKLRWSNQWTRFDNLAAENMPNYDPNLATF